MVTDLAELGLAVRSDGVIVADKRLSGLIDKSKKAELATERLIRQTEKLSKQMDKLGKGLTKWVTTPLGIAATAVVKFAADFESSFADIRKTVNATEPEFARMSKEIRQLSKVVPTSVEELNRLGGVAGQLGVQSKNIVAFTKTIAMLGDTTDIVGEEAALSLSRFMNIMGTSQDMIDRVGSTVVGLGNNFAAMESEIVNGATSLAAFGRQLGFSEAQVLAYSTAIAASGGETEAASSAFQKTATTMQRAVLETNEDLKVFARITGTSVAEFSRIFRDDASTAMVMFLQGLKDIGDQGLSTAAALEELGLTDIRLQREFGKVIGNIGQLKGALQIAGVEWENNTALTEEAQKRYETFNSKVAILWNNIKDLGITVGGALLPVIAKMTVKVKEWTDRLSGMNAATVESVLKWGALLAVLGPTLIVLGKILPTVVKLTTAIKALVVQQLAYQVALAKMAGAAGFSATAQISLATATGTVASAFKGLIALLGGPWVVAATAAAAAIMLLVDRQGKSAKASWEQATAFDAVRASIASMTAGELAQNIQKEFEHANALKAKIKELQRIIEITERSVSVDSQRREELRLLNVELDATTSNHQFLVNQLERVKAGWEPATAAVVDQRDALEILLEQLGLNAEGQDTLTEKVEDHVLALKMQIMTLGMSARQLAIHEALIRASTMATGQNLDEELRLINVLHDKMDAMEVLEAETKELEKTTNEATLAMIRDWQNVRQSFGEFFADLITQGENAFDALLQSWKRTAAQMAGSKLFDMGASLLGIAVPGAAASSYGAFGNVLSAGLGKFLPGLTGAGASITDAELQQLLGGKSANATGLNLTDLKSLGLNIGAGIAGGFAGDKLGESLFGKEANSSWGATAGGTAGSLIGGPLGAFIGSTIGSMIDVAFGGDGLKRMNAGFLAGNTPGLKAEYNAGEHTFASGLRVTLFARRAESQAAKDILSVFDAADAAFVDLVEQLGGKMGTITALRGLGEEASAGSVGNFFGLGGNGTTQGDMLSQLNSYIDQLADNVTGLDDELLGLIRSASSAEEVLSILTKAVADTAAEAENATKIAQFEEERQQALEKTIQSTTDFFLEIDQSFNALTRNLRNDMSDAAGDIGRIINSTMQEQLAHLDALRRQALSDHAEAIRQEEQLHNTRMRLSESLRQFATGLRIGDLSPLSNRGRFETAQSQFRTNLAATLAGDVDAAANLQNSAQLFAEQSRMMFGSSGRHITSMNEILAGLDAASGMLGASTFNPQAANDKLLEQLKLINEQLLSLPQKMAAELAPVMLGFMTQLLAAGKSSEFVANKVSGLGPAAVAAADVALPGFVSSNKTSAEAIREAVEQINATSGSELEALQRAMATAQEFGLSSNQVASALNLTQADVDRYLGLLGVPSFAVGGPITETGLINAHKGEHVITADRDNLVVNVESNTQDIAELKSVIEGMREDNRRFQEAELKALDGLRREMVVQTEVVRKAR